MYTTDCITKKPVRSIYVTAGMYVTATALLLTGSHSFTAGGEIFRESTKGPSESDSM